MEASEEAVVHDSLPGILQERAYVQNLPPAVHMLSRTFIHINIKLKNEEEVESLPGVRKRVEEIQGAMHQLNCPRH